MPVDDLRKHERRWASRHSRSASQSRTKSRRHRTRSRSRGSKRHGGAGGSTAASSSDNICLASARSSSHRTGLPKRKRHNFGKVSGAGTSGGAAGCSSGDACAGNPTDETRKVPGYSGRFCGTKVIGSAYKLRPEKPGKDDNVYTESEASDSEHEPRPTEEDDAMKDEGAILVTESEASDFEHAPQPTEDHDATKDEGAILIKDDGAAKGEGATKVQHKAKTGVLRLSVLIGQFQN